MDNDRIILIAENILKNNMTSGDFCGCDEGDMDGSYKDGIADFLGQLKKRLENSENVELVPTEGGYQKSIKAKIVRETEYYYYVTSESFLGQWKFSKYDCFRAGNYKKEFPKYKIELR